MRSGKSSNGRALRGLAVRVASSHVVAGTLARIPSANGVVLRYHSVNDDPGWAGDYVQPSLTVAPEVFDRQVEFLAARYRIVSIDELAESLREGRRVDRRAVAITFDDGHEDNYRFALPVLRKHGATAAFYVTTGAVGDETVLWTVAIRYAIRRSQMASLSLSFLDGRAIEISTLEQKESAIKLLTGVVKRAAFAEACAMVEEIPVAARPDVARPPQRVMMNWDEIRSVHRAGMTVGGHTVRHLNLPCLDTADVVREVRGSKEALESALGAEVAHFAYPNGRTERNFDARIAHVVAEAGFRSAVTCVSGPASPRCSRYAIPRLGVRESDWKVARLSAAIERARFSRPRHVDLEDVQRRGPK